MLRPSSLLYSAVTLASIAALSACQSLGREFQEPTLNGKMPTQLTTRTMEKLDSSEGTAQGSSSIIVDETAFMVRPAKQQSDLLPDFQVKAISATESGVQDAMQLMLEGSGLTLNIEGGPRAMERFGATSIQNAKGSLRSVLDTMSDQLGFFWSTKGKTLTIEPDRMFVVELPPVLAEDSLASMSNTMQYLGARDTYLDRMARTLMFRANRKTLAVIDQYLDGIRATRSMLVYEIQVYQVDLTDGNQQGIAWNTLTGSSLTRAKLITDGVTDTTSAGSTSGGGTTSTSSTLSDLATSFALTASGSGLGAVIMGPNFSLNSLVTFLKTQGLVKTVSQPRLAMLNGSKGMLRVGETVTYVSKVGSNVTTGVSQVTVETKDLRTGLELGITGEEHDSTITTRVSLLLSELVRFNKYTTLGTDLSLPDVTDRQLNTTIRLPAGYTALLGGITVTRESDDRQSGVPNNTKVQEVKRSEMVMVLKPTIVRFKKRDEPSPTVTAAAAAVPAVPAPISVAPVAVVAPVSPPAPAPVAVPQVSAPAVASNPVPVSMAPLPATVATSPVAVAAPAVPAPVSLTPVAVVAPAPAAPVPAIQAIVVTPIVVPQVNAPAVASNPEPVSTAPVPGSAAASPVAVTAPASVAGPDARVTLPLAVVAPVSSPPERQTAPPAPIRSSGIDAPPRVNVFNQPKVIAIPAATPMVQAKPTFVQAEVIRSSQAPFQQSNNPVYFSPPADTGGSMMSFSDFQPGAKK